MTVSNWMSWEGGVDLVGSTMPDSDVPNLIVHVARIVHTPVGSAPSGMVLFQPDPQQPPLFMGFVSTNLLVGNYFAPHIFADTPFAGAPTLEARIIIDSAHLPKSVSAHILIPGYDIEVEFSNLGNATKIEREIGAPLPFSQQGLEVTATDVALQINGKPIDFQLLPIGITGGAAAVWSPCGIYAR
ncbi:hypothetical protein [Chamaesiphon minutus]|uniref:Uncharacterized protein n=1 Tax=Chamaesiphon minutus (strain ATCC 27169 / PCC 6605) TaxID=1173020 RepID=K9UAA6_CHAP6|nr:hypothetical protein [Chamaesiphon minutus]AFY91558.1 hypothetical protein Cha6605_0256 [Chamaesiphon minutus PCC 6605]